MMVIAKKTAARTHNCMCTHRFDCLHDKRRKRRYNFLKLANWLHHVVFPNREKKNEI